jgi:cytochrome P450
MNTALRWDVSDFDIATAVLTCRDLTRVPVEAHPLAAHVLDCEGAAHRSLRTALRVALDRAAPRAALRTATTAAQLLDGLAGECDVAAGWVRPLALSVAADAVGVPTDQLPFWHEAAVQVDATLPDSMVAEVTRRITTLLATRRGNERHDVLSALAHIDAAPVDQLVATAFFALHAGYLNTSNLLGRALLALAEHPAQYTWLRAQDTAPLAAVDELLRFAAVPERATLRVADADVRIAGRTVPSGTRIYVRRAQANRDRGRFADPDRLNLQRVSRKGSLAFGAGRHQCPAAELVRPVTAVALTVLTRRVRQIRPTPRTDHGWDFPRPLHLVFDPQPVRRTP